MSFRWGAFAVAHVDLVILSCAPGGTNLSLDIRKCCADLVILQRAMKYVCSHCGADCETPLQCSRCKSVVYCGPACQRAHWALGHRAECQPRPEPQAVPRASFDLST